MSSTPDDDSNSNANGATAPSPRRSLPQRQRSTPVDANPNPVPRTLTRDELADLELAEFLSTLNSPSTSSSSSSPPSPSSTSPSPTTSTTTTQPPNSISPDALYPTTMSCRQAFDHAFWCQSPGGQFTNVYRYGTLRDCGESWRAFRFCMRAKSLPEEQRREQVRGWYRRLDRKYEVGPSSEDVWDIRTRPLVGAFAREMRRTEEGEGEGG